LTIGQGDEDLDEHEFDRMLRKMGDFDKKADDGTAPKAVPTGEDEDEEED